MFLLKKCCQANTKYVYQTKTKKETSGQFQFSEFPSSQKLPDNIEESESIIKIKKSPYNQLMRKHQTAAQKFTDFQFPPNSQSLGYFEQIGENYQWKRISEIIDEPVLFDNCIEPSDVITESLQKCYFLSAVAALAEVEARILQIFQNQKYNPVGIYKLNVRVFGVIKEIIVDDYIPVNMEGHPLFCQPKKNQFWVMILQKAWAKLKGSYQNIRKGHPSQVFSAFTYSPTKILPITTQQANQQKLWKQVQSETLNLKPICAGTIEQPDESQQAANKGLVWGHFYTVIAAQLVKKKQGQQWYKIIQLRNPWGRVEWTGHCSEEDDWFWDQIQEQSKHRLWKELKKEDDGIFFMKWEDFCLYFANIHFCYYETTPCYEIQPIYPDRKHGNIHVLSIRKEGEYIIELHQSETKLNNSNPSDKMGIAYDSANRGTIFLMKAKDFQFIDGAFTYDEYDSTVKVRLAVGKYLIYTKIDPIIRQINQNRQNWLYPRKCSVSIYSKYWVSNLKLADKKKISPNSPFYQKMFLDNARINKKKEFDHGNMWISWRQFLLKAGFAYICFGVELTSNNRFFVTFQEKDFKDAGYSLKKPYKGKGEISFFVGPGQQVMVIARVMKQEQKKKVFEFPPPLDVKIKGLK